MARKLRLEFPGACYHVINRGNYREGIFKTEGAKAAFEACLFEACTKSSWVLHGFVLMSNHYHLALVTPLGNLVAGMHWLQATFANRFNKLRGEHGHLFQGRYKSLLVEEGGPLGMVCDYIHLNPVRAGVVSVGELRNYRSSSLWFLTRPKRRPDCLQLETALTEAGGLSDSAEGWKSYMDYLEWQAAEGPMGRSNAYTSLSKGWALGSADFKATLIRDHTFAEETRAWEIGGVKEIRQHTWEKLFRRAMFALKRNESELTDGPKAAPWKVALATFLKERTQVSNPWLASRLGFRRPAYVSRLVSEMRRSGRPIPELTLLREKCTA